MDKIRLLLVEDHALVRQSIRALLESVGFVVVGEASTGQEAIEMACALEPQVVLMDIHLPQMNGIEATKRIRQCLPEVRILALTAYNDKAYQRAILKAGADAFVLKTAEFKELLDVIQQALQTQPTPAQPTPESPLTERELEVLHGVSLGWTNKQIGVHLGISDRTVQVHLQAIYHKLGVNNRTEAVLRGLGFNLIPPREGADE